MARRKTAAETESNGKGDKKKTTKKRSKKTARRKADENIPDEDRLERPRTQLAAGLLEALIQDLNRMSGTWKQLTKTQQDDYIDRLRQRIDNLVRQAVADIAGGDYVRARVGVRDLAIKDKENVAKVAILDKLHDVIDWRGHDAVLVLADPAQFFEGLADIEGEDEQKGLNFDDGNSAAED